MRAAFILAATTPPASDAAPAIFEAYRRAEAQAVQTPFLGIAAVLVVLAASFWLSRRAASSFLRISSLGDGARNGAG